MLERNPTLKAEMEAIDDPADATTKGKSVSVAFYIYPVMQVANILMVRAHLVPVGEDQLPHVELTREMARRFNCEVKAIFPEPEALVGRVPRLVGIDGEAKMSKSRGNTIDLKDSAEIVARKVCGMYAGRRGARRNRAPWRRTPSFCTSMHSILTLRMSGTLRSATSVRV